MKNYYVYKLTDKNTEEFYFGSRGCKCEVYDDKYMGSPTIWKPIKENLHKEILKEFKNVTDAILYERELIIENIAHYNNRNYAIPHPNITRDSLVTAINNQGKFITVNINDPLLGKTLFGVTKGKVVVRNEKDEIFMVSTNDPKYMSGEYVNVNLGRRTGKNHQNFGKKWINNGIEQKLVNKSYELDSQWVDGTKQKGLTTKSSHIGSVWINDNNKNIRIEKVKLQTYLDQNWKIGRINLKKYETRKNV